MTVKIGLWVAIAFFVCAGLFFTYKSITIKPKVVVEKSVLNPITGETTKLETYVDKAGDTHTVFKSSESNVITIKDLKDPNRPRTFADTLAEVYNIALRRIISLERIVVRLQSDSLQGVRVPNSKNVAYADKYARISYTPNIDTSLAGVFGLAVDLELNRGEIFQRDKVLGLKIGKKTSITDLSSPDERITFGNLKTVRVAKQVPFFGVRGQLMSGYSLNNGDIAAGVGLRVDLGKISFLGSYNYSTRAQAFRPRIGVTYDVFRF